jgi:hypothetical protein
VSEKSWYGSEGRWATGMVWRKLRKMRGSRDMQWWR